MIPSFPTSSRILVAPLDWGLGHATRCIPLIRLFLREGHDVRLAGSGRSGLLLRTFCPGLPYAEIPGYDITYQREGGSFIWKLALQVPRIYRAAYREHRWLENYLEQWPADVVISDNRYGLHTRRARTVLITHQVFPSSPALFRWFVHDQVGRYIRKFDACWVPDVEGEPNLSGSLSHGRAPVPLTYIGPLSRFSGMMEGAPGGPHEWPEVLVLLSGPEPQRTILENIFMNTLPGLPARSWLVRGTPEAPPQEPGGTFRVFPHLEDPMLAGAIRNASVVFCRSGYSSLMDLHALDRKAILIPTPGQTEQEYLAEHFRDRFGWTVMRQETLTPVMITAAASQAAHGEK